MTSSLFATTVIASFFVVALPHVLPCPAPRVVLADGEMPDGATRRKRRRRPNITERQDGIVQFNATSESDDDVATESRFSKRECPVPKPTGLLGELLGFKRGDDDEPRS